MFEIINDQIKHTDIYFYLLYIIPFILIVIYKKNNCSDINNHKDILEFEIFKGSVKYGIDGWSITHLLLFCIIGYIYPSTFIISMCIGSIWELFETYMGIYKSTQLKKWGFCDTFGSDGKLKVWWYGKWSDIIMNLFGFILGHFIKNNYKLNLY